MEDQVLREMLGAADRAAGVLDNPAPDLAARARRIAGERQRRARSARLGTGALAVLGLAFLVIARSQSRSGAPVVAAGGGAPAGMDLAGETDGAADAVRWLQAEADARMALVRRLQAEQARQRSAARVRQSRSPREPERSPEAALERAALILVVQGDHFSNHLGLTSAAAQLYSEAIASFPETRWAAEAHARLERMERGERG